MSKILKLPVTNGTTAYVNPLQVAWFRPAQDDSELRIVGEREPLWIRLSPDALASQLSAAMKD